MRYAFLPLAAIVVLTAFPSALSAQSAAAAERGKKLYVDQKCSLCHSVGGKGNPKGVLDDVATKLSADEIRHWLVNPQEMREKTQAERKPAMKSFATLSKDEVDALVAYLLTLKKK